MTEGETRIEDEFQKTRGVAGLTPSPSPSHVPGPGPDLDQGIVNVVSQNPGPGPGKGRENTTNIHLSLPEKKWTHDLKKRVGAGLDPTQEREGKKKEHPKVHTKLWGPLFHPPKAQSSCKAREKRKMSLTATPKIKKLVLK